MICVNNLEDIQSMCRICLTQSENMISMKHKLEEYENDPFVFDILENILSSKINNDEKYPKQICDLCYGNIKILLNLKQLYTKSQRILEKYVSSLDSVEYIHLFDVPPINIEYNDDFYDESSNISVIQDNVDQSDLVSDKELEEGEIPLKVVKLHVGAPKPKNVKVTWVEGNKFVIEKKPKSGVQDLQCTLCNQFFLSKESLAKHQTTCKKFEYKCEICHNKFASLLRKQRHVRTKHGQLNEIKCDVCGQTFKNHNARSYHKLTRHNTEGKKFKCEICGKAFFIKNSLSQHMECHSRDVSKVVCPICGKSFHYRGGLFYHMKIHRNERNYICSFCNKRFLTMASLKRHTLIHTGERPYTCSMCPKTFCSVGEVKTHERRHLGQKPFQCKYCSKGFLTPYNLKLHISSHTGTEPCSFCPKSFLNSEALKYHMDIKHFIRDKKNEIKVDEDVKNVIFVTEIL